METHDKLDPIISEEVLRQRIRKLIEEPRESRLASITRHPFASIIVGFIFTSVLATWINARQIANAKAEEARTHAHEKKVEKARQRRMEGLAAVKGLSEILNGRITSARMLGSALNRNASMAEIESRKAKFDEYYAKWSVQRYNTYITMNEINMGLYHKALRFESPLQDGFNELDTYLVTAYDKRINNIKWRTDPAYIACMAAELRRNANNLTNIIWVETRPGPDSAMTPTSTEQYFTFKVKKPKMLFTSTK